MSSRRRTVQEFIAYEEDLEKTFMSEQKKARASGYKQSRRSGSPFPTYEYRTVIRANLKEMALNTESTFELSKGELLSEK
jgi:hypothetical protein